MKRLIICLLSVLLFTGCQCTLHTHYYNDYGVCVCGHDKSIVLEYKNNEYTTVSHSIEANTVYYYKLDTHGEVGLDFIITNENSDEGITFDRIEIRGKGIVANAVAGNKYSNNPGKIYTSDLTYYADSTYNLKIRYYGEGTIQLKITKATV